jgi:hypothetical protein
VNQVSTARKLGVVAKVTAQFARQRAGRSRTLGALSQAARATARSFGRVLHQLWLEITGAIFFFMAAVGAIEVAREWTKYQAGRATSGRVAVAVCFTLMFAWFGLTSFWKVRQKGRSGGSDRSF